MIGLASNVGLTLTKGAAGWFMNSAALLADAAHSLGDLLSDFVTLYTFKMSRKMPDHKYPYGYGKFETMGSLAISSLLIAGAIGIGAHSFELLQATLNNASTIHVTQAIQETAPMMMTEAAQHQAVEKAATTTPASFAAIPSMLHDHGSHSHSLTSSDGTLNPNAAWFALASVLVKEWLYRATLKVGRSERSEVLIANAWHHRSDALSSGVAMVAIGGSYAGITVLDPLGGLVVAGMILKSTFGIAKSSLRELTDRGMESSEADKIRRIMAQMKNIEPNLIDFHSIRGRKLGPFYHVDMALKVNPELSVQEARRLEHRVRSAIQRDCEQVQQILVRLETPLSL
ncbi:cation efflux protein [Phascolomyces articulosus]|uniref:Cation efflux protein n=1 Tax=Phascolomyces articulosus TaxID=60185 RepID=A0AAD5K4Q9_9FUNG|nr:cation efflux protein [Phascolomyces articulosus]